MKWLKRFLVDTGVLLICVLAAFCLFTVARVLVIPFKGTSIQYLYKLVNQRGLFLFLSVTIGFAIAVATAVMRMRGTASRSSLGRLMVYALIPLLLGLAGTLRGQQAVNVELAETMKAIYPDGPPPGESPAPPPKLEKRLRRRTYDTTVVGGVFTAAAFAFILAAWKREEDTGASKEP